jgi:uncharacterized protein (TIGR02453 family)
MKIIHKDTLTFLNQLARYNNREWFNGHKQDYQSAHENVATFIDSLIILMNQHDSLETASGKQSLYRIYRDVRFRNDKTPYNPRFAFGLRRATAMRRGGYFMNVQPGKSYLACGFFAPNSSDLERIRQEIAQNPKALQRILKSKSIQSNFGAIRGEKVKTVPRGFAKDLEGIELIRHKQFILRHDFDDKELTAPDFLITVNKLFKSVRPYFDYMSEVLTTNLNGESII